MNVRTPIVAALLGAVAAAPAAQARETWPSEVPAESFTERVVHTSTVELGAYDCTPASVVMVARTLGLRVPVHANAAIETIRREARWPQDGIGLPLDKAGKVLERRGAKVEYAEGLGLAGFSKAVNRGAVALMCGRNGEGELHTIAVVDYDVDANTWLIHDPDREEPSWVSNADLKRFRANGCKDKIDLLVQPRGSRSLIPSRKGDEEASKSSKSKAGKSKAGKSKAGAGKRGKGKTGSQQPASEARRRQGKRPAGARLSSSEIDDKLAEEPTVPRGGLGLAIALLSGLLVLLVGAIIGVRRGWFERYDLDEPSEPSEPAEVEDLSDDDTA